MHLVSNIICKINASAKLVVVWMRNVPNAQNVLARLAARDVRSAEICIILLADLCFFGVTNVTTHSAIFVFNKLGDVQSANLGVV